MFVLVIKDSGQNEEVASMLPLSNELQLPEFNIISKEERDGVVY